MKRIDCIIITFLFSVISFAQKSSYEKIQINEKLEGILNDSINSLIINQLDTLFYQIVNTSINDQIIKAENSDLTIAVLKGLQGIKSFDNDSENLNNYDKQLTKFYPISENTYSISVAFINNRNKEGSPFIKTIFRLIAENENGKIKFSTPLSFLTKEWKSTTLGNITYYYKDTIKINRAQRFNSKNNIISKKMNVPVEQFKFYMCENYQEILNLLGYEYQLESATTTRLGYGVEKGHIFSIMNNEDFSHDIFHYYSGKIHEPEDRNWIAEEGIACSWGNAYYTDTNGEMIELNRLIHELQKYLLNNEGANVLSLFYENTKIFKHIAPELSVRSVISGIICNEIENLKGIDGITKIINCGRSPNSLNAYFSTLNKLIGINETNFDNNVRQLLNKY